MVNNYFDFIQYAEEEKNKYDNLKKAIHKLVKSNADCFAASDIFSKAMTDEVGFDFNVHDYGIRKISDIVKRQSNGDLECAEYHLCENFEQAISKNIKEKATVLGVIDILADMVVNYFFENWSNYKEEDYNLIKTIIKESDKIDLIINIVLKVKINVLLENCSANLECMSMDLSEYINNHPEENDSESDFKKEEILSDMENIKNSIYQIKEDLNKLI